MGGCTLCSRQGGCSRVGWGYTCQSCLDARQDVINIAVGVTAVLPASPQAHCSAAQPPLFRRPTLLRHAQPLRGRSPLLPTQHLSTVPGP